LNFRTLIAATALLAGTQVALAQSSSAPAPASSPAKKELIAKLVQLHQPVFENMGRGLLQGPVGNMMQAAGQALQQLPADKREAAAKAIEADIKKFVDETAPLVASRASKTGPEMASKLFEERFTEDELKQLVSWLESSANKKYAQFGGELQKQLAEKVVADSRSTIEPRLRTLEQSVKKHLGIPTAAAPASAPAKK
jgi:hypothetical protein